MKKLMVWLVSIGFLVFCLSYDLSLSKSDITGVYVSSASTNLNCSADYPNKGDTLMLFIDDRLESRFWGEGSYKLYFKEEHVEIDLKPEDTDNGMTIRTQITNRLFETPRILLCGSQYYYKLND